ncbi:MAG: hypothetical protein ACOYL6_16835 [Bacteriovoracaceae bacterium]
MKLRPGLGKILLFTTLALMSSSVMSQISGGSGGGGPINVPLPEDFKTSPPCREDYDEECKPSKDEYRVLEKKLIEYIFKGQISCLGLPLYHQNIIDFYKHIILRNLVNSNKTRLPQGCEKLQEPVDEYFECLMSDPFIEAAFMKFVYFKEAFEEYLISEYKISMPQAKEIANYFFNLRTQHKRK